MMLTGEKPLVAFAEWRIDAYLLLHQTAIKTGWREGFERMEGSFLGYKEWQNDAILN